jgi:hypothetical protein
MSYAEDIETFTLDGLKSLAEGLGVAKYGTKTDIVSRITGKCPKGVADSMLQTLFDSCKAEKAAKKEKPNKAENTMVVADKLDDSFLEKYGMELAKEEEGEDGKTTFTYVMKKGGKKASGGGGTPVKKEKKEKKDGPTPTIVKKTPIKKKDIVVVDDDDDDEEKLIPVEAFSARLKARIGDDRDLVDKLLHKYDPAAPMTRIKGLTNKKALLYLCDLMCNEEEE